MLRALYPRSTQLPLTEADNWYAALAAGKGTAYLGDYLQLRYLMREYPDQGLRLRRLRSDELVVSYRLMMRDQPELRAHRYRHPLSAARRSLQGSGSLSGAGEQDINPLHFTDKEQAWLVGTSRAIKLVVNPDFMPYSGLDEQGGSRGGAPTYCGR